MRYLSRPLFSISLSIVFEKLVFEPPLQVVQVFDEEPHVDLSFGPVEKLVRQRLTVFRIFELEERLGEPHLDSDEPRAVCDEIRSHEGGWSLPGLFSGSSHWDTCNHVTARAAASNIGA